MKSQSRDAVLECLGFISVSSKFGKVLDSSRTENPKVSVSGLNVSFYKLIFDDKSSLKLPYYTFCRSHTVLFSRHRLVKFIYYQAFALVSTYQFDNVTVHAMT